MRIGVVKQQVRKALGNKNQIALTVVPLYGNQAFRVSDFRKTDELIKSLVSLSIIGDDSYSDDIRAIFEKINNEDSFEISAQEYNKLNGFIQKINVILPVLIKTVGAFSPDQDEQIINIKLPGNISTLDDLNKFNNRLDTIFSKIGVTDKNGLVLKGFDSGSEWYQILIDNGDFFKWAVVVIGIAWSCVKIRKEWFDSEISRLTLKSLKEDAKKNEKLKPEDDVVKKILEVKINEEVSIAINSGLPLLGKNKKETETQLSNAVKSTIEEIDHGTEFHLSLNPPKDISEMHENGLTSFDYTQIFEIDTTPKKDPKEIESGNTTTKEQ